MKNKKLIISVLIIFVFIVTAILIFSPMGKKLLDNRTELITHVDVNLSVSDREFVEKRLANYEKQFSELSENASIIDKVNLYFVMAADYRMLGEYGKAKELLESAMAIDPKNSNLISTYSSLLAIMGDKETALTYIDKAIELYGAESNYWLWKIDLEKELNSSVVNIEKVYKDALEKTNNDLNIIVSYAQFLETQKKYSESITYWEKAIIIYPQNKSIYETEVNRLKTFQ